MAARRTVKLLAASAAVLAGGVFAGSAIALASTPGHTPAHRHHDHDHSGGLTVKQILFGQNLSHTFTPAGSSTPVTDPLTGPDDITAIGHKLFVAFQNGVGSMGEATSDGNTQSTVVEFTGSGKVLNQWDVVGKVDGLTADGGRFVIATVNEDGNSSLYTIKPSGQIVHYSYNASQLTHNGGTDAISIWHGKILISASAPGTTGAPAPNAAYPAVYVVKLHKSTQTADATPLFFDEDPALVANTGSTEGSTVNLALTDPDSSEIVPGDARRFHGDFMLNSQGDEELIFVSHHARNVKLQVLSIANSVDDSAWATGRGQFYGSDASADTVDVVTGDFPRGAMLTAVTPCNANSAPSTCTTANFLAWVNLQTGALTEVTPTGPAYQPKGLIFVGGNAAGHRK